LGETSNKKGRKEGSTRKRRLHTVKLGVGGGATFGGKTSSPSIMKKKRRLRRSRKGRDLGGGTKEYTQGRGLSFLLGKRGKEIGASKEKFKG